MTVISNLSTPRFGAVFHLDEPKVAGLAVGSNKVQAQLGIDRETAQKVMLYGITGAEEFLTGDFLDVTRDSQGFFGPAVVATGVDIEAYKAADKYTPQETPHRKEFLLQHLIGQAVAHKRYHHFAGFTYSNHGVDLLEP